MEQGGRQEPAYELGLGEKLGLAYEREHDTPACVQELDDMALAYVLEQVLHNLHRIHLQYTLHNDQLCILHSGAYHLEEGRCIHH